MKSGINAIRDLFMAARRPVAPALKEPFLSPTDGKLYTTGRLQRSSMRRRWLVLALTSLLMSCNYYCYDTPAALYKPLSNAFWREPAFEYYFNLLYSVYSIPNIVLPLVGGLLVDKVGLYFSLNLFSAFILAGQAVFAAGCSIGSLQVMLLGRFLFGLGGESISVAQSALIERWFQQGELALALGLCLSVARLGSVVNNALSPYIAYVTFQVAWVCCHPPRALPPSLLHSRLYPLWRVSACRIPQPRAEHASDRERRSHP